MLAVLICDIDFIACDTTPVFIPEGTRIYVDTKKGIAYFNKRHFHISSHEYSPVN